MQNQLRETSFATFVQLSQQADRVVIIKEIFGDQITPITAFQSLAEKKQKAVLLDSSDHAYEDDACIYMGFDPIAEFNALQNQITIIYKNEIQTFQENPFQKLRYFFNKYKCACEKSLAKFAGGMIGFISYDAVRAIEEIPNRHLHTDEVPDINFKFYETHVVFDKRTGKVTIAQVIEVGKDLQHSFDKAQQKIAETINCMFAVKHHISARTDQQLGNIIPCEMTTDLSDEQFVEMVKKAQQYIYQGDAFQIVTSREYRKKFNGSVFDIYRALRLLNPSPYQFYIRDINFSLVGSSPEKLVSLRKNIIETMPIAGTRPRGVTREQDLELENDLVNNEKEMAEHAMLVDLGRNDVGMISQAGSVKVVEYAKVNRFSRVMHLVSRIQGKLKENFDAIDVLQFAFPAGTLTGAPKIRAMEIIDEIEHSRRGVYGGAICAIDHEGELDSCITIRTALIKNNEAIVRAGAGIVLDSVPLEEAEESRRKALCVFDAIALAERGFL